MQTEQVRQRLSALYPDLTTELLPVVTQGDRFLTDPLYKIGGKALFLKELEHMLLEHKADIAVHSLKDVPADLPEGLTLSAICKRGDPYDTVVFNQHQEAQLSLLPKHALIGTASLRRRAQLLAYRPDLVVQNIRGNINSRLRKLDEGHYDALVLATVGLDRLSINQDVNPGANQYKTMELPSNIMLPAVGQGAIAIESRADDQHSALLVKPLHDSETFLCVSAERLIQAKLNAGCQTPLAAYAEINQYNHMNIKALVASEDGKEVVRVETQGKTTDYQVLAEQLVSQLIAMGAHKLMR